jgi:alanine racemase
MTSRCFAEISLDALRHNAAVLRRANEMMAVVKANAYGHGAVMIAKALNGTATAFGVANIQEARELREAGIKSPILLLGACLPEERETALREGFQMTISSMEEAKAYDDLAKQLGVTAHAHAVVDSGMGRMGFPEALWTVENIATLLETPHLIWEGLCSHLPSADEDAEFTREQIERFHTHVQRAWDAGFITGWVHLENSAGILGFPEATSFCNLSRCGLALYGVSPLPEMQDKLKPVLTWKTRVLLVRELPAGHGVSYGRAKILDRPTLVATLACGYADGYPRQVSGKDASVLIHGKRCPLLGRVTMDQIMVDVTDLPEPAQPGDEAVLLGSQDGETIGAHELAKLADTIAWHIFTSITARVERVVV